ncbi:MAG: type IV toxin-antitoxin system AbiEi family antitoxin [Candidatus Omnitrophota bacterium]
MNNMKTLGKVSANLISRLYDEDKTIFEISDVQRILAKNYNQTTDLLSRLVKRKVITRLKAGKFLIIPQQLGSAELYVGNWYVATREVVNSPLYYVAFYGAMHYWGMLTQPLIKIFTATPKRQTVPLGMRDKLIFVFVKKKSIWGVNEEWVTKTEKVRISDLEKTIIDAVAHPQYCGGITEIAKGIWIVKEKIDYERLKDYVDRCGKNVAAKRLGYILDILKIRQPVLLGQCKKYIRKRYDLFDPTLPVGKVDKNNWHLIDNVGQKQIFDLIGH